MLAASPSDRGPAAPSLRIFTSVPGVAPQTMQDATELLGFADQPRRAHC
jgi:hypothetical protein